MKVRSADVDSAQGRLAQAEASREGAELNLAYTTIRAPGAGRVSRKSVEPGQVVQAGQQLLAVVDLDDVWIVANQGDRAHRRAARPAGDGDGGYVPGRRRPRPCRLHPGRLRRRLLVLPPENATGNFVKVVQRIPVKLALERGENRQRLLVPGMSVVPTIALR